MSDPGKDERRPLAGAAINVTAGDVDHDTRCRRCKHPIYAARSVATGLGPDCRRIMLADLLADLTPAQRVAVGMVLTSGGAA